MVRRTGALHVSRGGHGGAGRLRLLRTGLSLRVVCLGKLVILDVAAGDCPLVVAALDGLVPHSSVTAGELVLEVATLSVRDTPVELLAALGVPLEALALAQSSGVFQVLRSGLGSWLRLRLL